LTNPPQRLEISPAGAGVVFWIHVTPRARRAAVGGVHAGALCVRVAEPPLEGRANAACRRALADALGVPAAAVALDAGARGRRKRVSVEGEAAGLAARLEALAGGRARASG
jgi:hypothetical protein